MPSPTCSRIKAYKTPKAFVGQTSIFPLLTDCPPNAGLQTPLSENPVTAFEALKTRRRVRTSVYSGVD
jgi:hypothetical protein